MKTIIFLPILAGFLFWGCNEENQTNIFNINTLEVNNNIYKLDQCIIANESFGDVPKFEIDLKISDQDNSKFSYENSELKNIIWLSVNSNKTSELSDGIYNYTTKNPGIREHMTFSGSVFTGREEANIAGGEISLRKKGDEVRISLDLVDKNNKAIKGNYSGTFQYIDRKLK